VKVQDGYFDLTPLQRMLMSLIERNPGISQKKISQLTEVSPATINRHIHELVDRSLITITRGTTTKCYVIQGKNSKDGERKIDDLEWNNERTVQKAN
jgi:DNA-binding MarR family transcriptional regulator